MAEQISGADRQLERKSAVSIRPKEPMFDWIREFAHKHPLDWTADRIIKTDEPIVWLITSTGTFDSGQHLREYLGTIKVGMMKSEFRGTAIDESFWPRLNDETFEAFFEMIVFDHVASAGYLTKNGS